ncbi:MAG: class I SAM-dependent methyltransferase [Clostridia bacterium]|nr:class I SAM-dependent methyltransferase [Clostridia bacterium]
MRENAFKPSKSEKRGLKQLKSTMKNILSIGISTGGSAEINMAKTCPEAKIVATTIDEKGLKFSIEKMSNYKEFAQIEAKIEDVSKPMIYADNTFDYVYARLVLHYLNKQQLNDALNEIYRVLKPNGTLFVVARNNKEWELIKPEFVISYDEETNITTYYEQWKKEIIRKRQFLSEDQLKEVLTAHNFKIKSVKSYREKLYTDYERTRKYRSKKPNYLTEVVAVK